MVNPLDRQCDFMIATQPSYLDLPNNIKGKLTDNDYVHFSWDSTFDKIKNYYQVVLETLSYQPEVRFRKVGPLLKSVKLPLTHFSNDALILLIPSVNGIPVYVGSLKRGKSYIISTNKKYKNYYLLQ